jgi:hypothetical protein
VGHSGLGPQQIVTTGVNRFDFYVEPMRRLLARKSDVEKRYGLTPGRPIVTWATNFAHAGYALKDGEFIQRDWDVRGLTKIPGYTDARAYAAADLRSMRDAQQIMLEIFKHFPQINFVIKTHPAERLDMYLEYLEQCRRAGASNVALVNREYIGDLLNVSSVEIHRYCTTGLEAWIMGLPTLNFHLTDWHADPSGGGALGDAAQYDHRVSTFEDVRAGLEAYLGGTPVEPRLLAGRREVLSKWLYRLDGQSTARQARAIAAFLAADAPSPRRSLLALGGSARGAIKRLAQMGVNTVLGRGFDLPLAAPTHHRGVEVNELGYADRLVRQPDVERWCRTIRNLRAELSAAPAGLPAPVGAADGAR